MTLHNWKLYEKYQQLQEKEARAEIDCPPGCDLAVAAFGSCARIARTAVDRLRRRGVAVGLIRPVTLFPFPGGKSVRPRQRRSACWCSR